LISGGEKIFDRLLRWLLSRPRLARIFQRLLDQENSRLLGDQFKLIAINERLLSDREKILNTNALVLAESIEQQPYMREKGWYVTIRDRESVDLSGSPIPWYTYPAIKYLENHVERNHFVFEFGAGNSSLWYAKRAARTVSIESDLDWFKRVSELNKENKYPLEIIHRPPNDPSHSSHYLLDEYFERYPEKILDDASYARGLVNSPFLAFCNQLIVIGKNKKPNIIAIDTYARGLCSFLAMRFLAQDGIIVFDNSDWPEYDFIKSMFAENGFLRTDYFGPGPLNHYEWCTSVFKRSSN